MRFYILFLIISLFSYQSNAQNLKKYYEKAFKYYEKKDYISSIEICDEIISKLNENNPTTYQLSYCFDAAYLNHYMYNDSTGSVYDKEIGKTYLEISKSLLDALLILSPDLKNALKSKFDYIENILKESKQIEPDVLVKNNQISSDDFEVIVSGEGKTKETAIQNALRQAIEQAFGSFISSITKIVNDSLVLDEMTSISNGNIKKYDILNETKFNNDKFIVTVKALLSIKSFTNYCNSKGYKVEFDGGMFAINIQKQILNETSEIIALKNLALYTEPLFKNAFDYKIILNTPTSKSGDNNLWNLEYYAKVVGNENLNKIFDFIEDYINSVSMSDEVVYEYSSIRKSIYGIRLDGKKYHFRTHKSLNLIEFIFFQMYSAINNYKIKFVANGKAESLSYLNVYRESQLSFGKIYDLEYILSHNMGYGYSNYEHGEYYSFIHLLKDWHEGSYLHSDFQKLLSGNEVLNIKGEIELSLDQLKIFKEVLMN